MGSPCSVCRSTGASSAAAGADHPGSHTVCQSRSVLLASSIGSSISHSESILSNIEFESEPDDGSGAPTCSAAGATGSAGGLGGGGGGDGGTASLGTPLGCRAGALGTPLLCTP